MLYGYFDTLARYIVESESWSEVPTLPLVAPSSDFVVMRLHLEAMAAAKRKDPATAKARAAEDERARVQGQHPFVQQILTMQAREAGQRPRMRLAMRRRRCARWRPRSRSKTRSTACHSRPIRSFPLTSCMDPC